MKRAISNYLLHTLPTLIPEQMCVVQQRTLPRREITDQFYVENVTSFSWLIVSGIKWGFNYGAGA